MQDTIRPGLFRNRREAGRRLAEKLGIYADRQDVIVLGLPRGGVPVAYEVARRRIFSKSPAPWMKSRGWLASGSNSTLEKSNRVSRSDRKGYHGKD
jgi:hypothetical protein